MALSSGGRAPRLQRGGRGFKSLSANNTSAVAKTEVGIAAEMVPSSLGRGSTPWLRPTMCGRLHGCLGNYSHVAPALRSIGILPQKVAKCGTPSGRYNHYKRGEKPCEACLLAHRESRKPRRYWRSLWSSQNGVCALCDLDMPRESRAVEVDHRIPQSDEGPDDIGNLQLVHGSCNRLKGTLSHEEARAKIRNRMAA